MDVPVLDKIGPKSKSSLADPRYLLGRARSWWHLVRQGVPLQNTVVDKDKQEVPSESDVFSRASSTWCNLSVLCVLGVVHRELARTQSDRLRSQLRAGDCGQHFVRPNAFVLTLTFPGT